MDRLGPRQLRRSGFGLWAVERTVDGAFLGDCGPMLQPVEGELVPEIGYHIVRREWGHGYATEAAVACRDLVLGAFGFSRVVSIVAPENLALTPCRREGPPDDARVRLGEERPRDVPLRDAPAGAARVASRSIRRGGVHKRRAVRPNGLFGTSHVQNSTDLAGFRRLAVQRTPHMHVGR